MDLACQHPDFGCDSGVMTHVAGAAFVCDTCGRSWQPEWLVIDALDRLVCEQSLTDGPTVQTVIRIATGQVSGDNEPAADDLPAMLGLPELPTAVVIAWAAWRAEYDARVEAA